MQRLGLTTLERRRINGDLTETFKILTDIEKVDKEHFFEFSDTGYYLRGHSETFSQQMSSGFQKIFFSNRVVRHWNGLTQQIVDAQSVTPSRIVWSAIGKIWAFKEYSSHPSSIKYQVSLECIGDPDCVAGLTEKGYSRKS